MSYFRFFFMLLNSATLLYCNTASAMLQENLLSGDQTAQTFLNQMNQKKGGAGAHPFYQGISKEAKYKDTELKGRGQAACVQNPASQMIVTSSDKRPQMKIDPAQDPLITGSQKVMENPLEIIGGKGTQVVEIQQGGKTENIICEEAGEDSLETCTRELTVRVEKIKVQREWNGAFQYSKCCNAERRDHHLVCGSLRSAVSSSRRKKVSRKGVPAPVDPDGGLNITQAYKACIAELASLKGRGCRGCYAFLPTLSFPVGQIKKVLLIKNPNNPRRILTNRSYFHEYNSGRTEYDIHPLIKIIYEEDSYRVLPDEWNDNCARLEARVDQGLCGYYSKACTQGRQTRTINGVPITRDCWQETMTYACSFPAKDDCGPLRARGCAQIHSQCKQYVGNACVVYQQTYQCNDLATI